MDRAEHYASFDVDLDAQAKMCILADQHAKGLLAPAEYYNLSAALY